MNLAELLPLIIRAQGGMDVAAYMRLVMSHPTLGYYANRDPFGVAGDFTTAPEISQICGELVGLALAQHWLDLGGPAVRLVELGPGRGTLMRDALRATAGIPGFHTAVALHLVESSPRLRHMQADRISMLLPSWHDDIGEVPDDRPLLLVANEFVDALPVRQFYRAHNGWHERLVTLREDGSLDWGVTAAQTPFATELAKRHEGASIGTVVELSPDREALVQGIARRIERHGGCALLIDYGARRLDGPTLQAVRRHGGADPLEAPGDADVSSLVDFGSLARAALANGCRVWGPLDQGAWLDRLGGVARLERLAATADRQAARALREGFARLVDPAAMGRLFKVLALTGGTSRPPGFEPDECYRP